MLFSKGYVQISLNSSNREGGRMKKTALEHFQDIKELEVADGPEITVEDLLPYKCERVEKYLKALEIIKEKRVNVGTFIHLTKVLKKDYEKCKGLNNTFGANICDSDCEFLTKEEFNLLKEVLE